jgi:pyruvate,water dikinase
LLDAGETPLTRRIELLYDLACAARRDAEVAALVTDAAPDALARLSALPQGRVLLEQLERFLAEYGEHTGNGWGSEALLRQPTWRERPETALAFLGPFLDPQVEPPVAARRRAQQVLAAEVEALGAACQDSALAREFRRQWDYARKVHAVLEVHNHYIDQISTGQLRHAVMAAGRRLAARGALPASDDVLWLSFDEIASALCGAPDAAFSSLADLIGARKQRHAEWLSLEAPPVLGVPEARLPERPPPGDDVSATGREERGVLAGQGASLGRRRGRARVVVDADSVPKVQRGDILVAWNVGPAWLPLFPSLGGLVLEGGSIGQHAAATAREYGLPAVVNVKRAVERITDRAWVTVDGTTGIVELS